MKTLTHEELMQVHAKAVEAFMQGFNDEECHRPSGRTDDLYLMGRERARQLEMLEADRIG